MRRLLLCLALVLVTGLLLALVYHPEATPDEPTSVKVTEGADELPDPDPVAFLEKCLERYNHDIKGMTGILQKQERISGKLQPTEEIEFAFREKPHSVYMRWLKGARRAERALYVEGENNGKLLSRPAGVIARKVAGDVVERDLDSADARQAGRYSLDKFGMKKGTERTLASWKKARARGTLEVKYLGVFQVKEAGDRLCYKLQRPRYDKPEDDGVTSLTVYIDKENWLQVGSVLKGEDNKLIGEYFFRDLKLNPEFKPNQFTPEALKP
jgi:hypothetical protein